MFVCWIIASTLFLVIVYNCRYRSNWQEVSIKVTRSIWREKDTDDFLHYVRHEYIVFCLSICPTIFDYSVIYFIWDTLHYMPDSQVLNTVVLLILQVSRLWSLVMLKSMVDSDATKTPWTSLIVRAIIQVAAIAAFFWLLMDGNGRFIMLYMAISLSMTLLILIHDFYL